MTFVSVPEPFPPGATDLTRVCAFRLSTALLWLGHECRGGCPAAAATWRASVWFAGPPLSGSYVPREPREASSADTVVVVDFDAPAPPPVLDALLQRVNACVARDHLLVRQLVRQRT